MSHSASGRHSSGRWRVCRKATLRRCCCGSGPPRQESESGFVLALADVLDTIPDARWLVLDDVHHLRSRTVLADLDKLLSSRTDNLRFILIGRFDPTLSSARLRVSGELCELRAAELAFSLTESRSLLAMHDVVIDDADLTELYRRTEGWAAGLRLAALSLSGTDDRHAAVTSFAGDQPMPLFARWQILRVSGLGM